MEPSLHSFQKTKRVENKQLLAQAKRSRCVACGRVGSDPHHIQSRGAGGPDASYNILYLCRQHHTEVHQIGYRKMCDKYLQVELVLISKGWHFDDIHKLIHTGVET